MPTVASIYRYPVKGLGPDRLASAELLPGRTIAGDHGILDVTQLEDKIRPDNEHLRQAEGMIARTWRGAVRREDGDAYAEYMQETGVAGYKETAGNRGVWMLRRDVGELTEFVMFTLWDSLDAVKGFAGEDLL